jgi:hypothetical protein
MEFATDPEKTRLYAVGSCAYAPGLSVLDLNAGGAPVTLEGGFRLLENPKSPILRVQNVCGERLAVTRDSIVVIAQTKRPVPDAGLPGALLVINGKSGELVRTIRTPSEPVDVLVTEPRTP